MKKYYLVIVALIFLAFEVFFFIRQSQTPRSDYPLKVRVPLLGATMVLENIGYEMESGNILRIRGSYFDGIPPQKYKVQATLSETLNGTPSDLDLSSYTLLPQNAGAPGYHFFIDLRSPPTTVRIIFCHVSFVDPETKEVVANFTFKTANPALSVKK